MPETVGKPLSREHETLIRQALPLVQAMARSMARTQQKGVWEELTQVGMAKCLELLVTYDEGRGSFLSYMTPHVRGAMLLSLRLERRVLVRAMAMNATSAPVLEGLDFGNLLNEEEPVRRARFEETRHAIATSLVLGLVSAPFTPEELLELKQEQALIHDTVHEALATLEPVDRELIESYDLAEKTLKESAEAVGVKYAAAGYRHTKALDKLGKRLQHPSRRK